MTFGIFCFYGLILAAVASIIFYTLGVFSINPRTKYILETIGEGATLFLVIFIAIFFFVAIA